MVLDLGDQCEFGALQCQVNDLCCSRCTELRWRSWRKRWMRNRSRSRTSHLTSTTSCQRSRPLSFPFFFFFFFWSLSRFSTSCWRAYAWLDEELKSVQLQRNEKAIGAMFSVWCLPLEWTVETCNCVELNTVGMGRIIASGNNCLQSHIGDCFLEMQGWSLGAEFFFLFHHAAADQSLTGSFISWPVMNGALLNMSIFSSAWPFLFKITKSIINHFFFFPYLFFQDSVASCTVLNHPENFHWMTCNP